MVSAAILIFIACFKNYTTVFLISRDFAVVFIMEFIATPKGGRRLVINGNGYVLDRKREDSSDWRCDLRKKCTTVNDAMPTNDPTEKHNHPPNPAKVCNNFV